MAIFKTKPNSTLFNGSEPENKGLSNVPRPMAPVPAPTVLASDDHASLAKTMARFQEMHGRPLVIAVDLDGTTADFTHGIRTHIARKINIPRADWANMFPNGSRYAMWEGDDAWFPGPEDFQTDFRAFENLGGYRTLEVYENAQEISKALVHHGFKLRVVTARGMDFNQDTQHWIRTNMLPLGEITNSVGGKHLIEGKDVSIEDSPTEIKLLLDNGEKVIGMNHAYNKHIVHENFYRIDGWDKLPAALEFFFGK